MVLPWLLDLWVPLGPQDLEDLCCLLSTAPCQASVFPGTVVFNKRESLRSISLSEEKTTTSTLWSLPSNTFQISLFSCCWGTRIKTTVFRTWKLQFTYNQLQTCFQSLKLLSILCYSLLCVVYTGLRGLQGCQELTVNTITTWLFESHLPGAS